jgi:acetyl esterase/lipase
MRNLILLLCSLLLTQISFGQNAGDLFKTGDSLYKARDYKNAAIAFNAGISMQNNNAAISRYRSAAGSWAMANMPDSAFQLLKFISKSDKVSKIDLQQIEYGIDYAALRTDKRWNPVLDNIRKQAEKNGYPQEEFIYGRKDGMGLTLIMVKPRPTGSSGQAKVKSNGKAIISVRSGNWVSGYNGIEVQPYGIDQYLAKGYTVFAVFHGSQPRYAIPDEVEDLKRAVRYIRYNAGKFHIDPNHIGITGSSSGGNLSLLVATADEKIDPNANDPVDRVSSRVQAIAVLFPPTDVLNWGGKGNNMANAKELLKPYKVWGAFIYKTWNEAYALYDEVTDTSARNKIAKEISPIYAVSPDDPPVFILHGDADQTVPLQQSQSIIARFNEAGVINNFIIKKGGKHNADDMNPEWQQFVDWFDKYLK